MHASFDEYLIGNFYRHEQDRESGDDCQDNDIKSNLLLALLPGQSMKAPSAHSATVVTLIQLALETLEHIIDFSEPFFYQQFACDQ